MLYPLLMQAPVKDYIWGGTRLREKYNKVSTADKLAESWELSCHPAGPSVIANGPAKGETLEQYLEKKGMALLGTKGKDCKNFPIMIKLIDAKDNLSVQVHPDDAYALKNEGELGKTEMWYIVLDGGICAADDVFLMPLKRKVNCGIFGGTKFAPVEIVVASLGNDAGIYGAAALAFNKD